MKLILSTLVILNLFFSFGQLNAGDIAFIGYNTDGADDFAFITLADIPAGEVIYFTEEGWDVTAGNWAGTSEGHATYTAPAGGLSCGTVVRIFEASSNNLSVDGSGSVSLSTGSWSLSAGDQVLAYQAAVPEPATLPTFISGVHGDDGNGSPLSLDGTTGWNNTAALPLGNARSNVPAGLTNGTNCVSLFPTIGTELDNARYNGTLIGSASALRTSINDRTNWISNDASPYAIGPATFSPSVTCSGLPVELSIFEAKAADKDVALNWRTESELNNSGFDVMHSLDGVTWSKIGFVEGVGTTSSQNHYDFMHRSVSSGFHYYQLIQRDWDGEWEASPVQTVIVEGSFQEGIVLSPNPSNGDFVRIISDSEVESVRVTDASGRIVEVNFDKGSQRFVTGNLEDGVYTIRTENADGDYSTAIFIQAK